VITRGWFAKSDDIVGTQARCANALTAQGVERPDSKRVVRTPDQQLGRPLYWPAMTVRRVEYEVERVRLGRHLSRNAVRQLLTDHAEYGGWELARLRRYRDGTRDAWIRRKIIRFPRR
jgi:Family of unknown function (DUF5703)